MCEGHIGLVVGELSSSVVDSLEAPG